MAPAFHSSARAAAFGGVVLFFLTLPVILDWIGPTSREQMYRGISERVGAFDFIRRQIFDSSSDLDVVFCGSSLLAGAIDPRYVERELSRAVGRRASVVVLPQSWQGPDMNYFVARDLLEARRVKMLVIASPSSTQQSNQPHVQLFRVVRYGDHPNALDGLGMRHRLSIYADFVLGAPRHALSLVRVNHIDPDAGASIPYGTAEGYRGRPFKSHETAPSSIPADSMIYSIESRDRFRFVNPPLNSYQLHFLQKTAELAREHDSVLAILHIPSPVERGAPTVFERQRLPEIFGDSVAFVGVPSSRLFQDIPGAEFFDYYHDEHLNTNGMALYTKAITPALIELYERYYATSRRPEQ